VMIRWTGLARHGNLNIIFQIALHLPS
jgi:hypothetical protein